MLALGSVQLTALQLRRIAPADASQVAAVVLVLVVPRSSYSPPSSPSQNRDVVMATGLGVLTGSWAASATLLMMGDPGTLNPVLGVVAIVVSGDATSKRGQEVRFDPSAAH